MRRVLTIVLFFGILLVTVPVFAQSTATPAPSGPVLPGLNPTSTPAPAVLPGLPTAIPSTSVVFAGKEINIPSSWTKLGEIYNSPQGVSLQINVLPGTTLRQTYGSDTADTIFNAYKQQNAVVALQTKSGSQDIIIAISGGSIYGIFPNPGADVVVLTFTGTVDQIAGEVDDVSFVVSSVRSEKTPVSPVSADVVSFVKNFAGNNAVVPLVTEDVNGNVDVPERALLTADQMGLDLKSFSFALTSSGTFDATVLAQNMQGQGLATTAKEIVADISNYKTVTYKANSCDSKLNMFSAEATVYTLKPNIDATQALLNVILAMTTDGLIADSSNIATTTGKTVYVAVSGSIPANCADSTSSSSYLLMLFFPYNGKLLSATALVNPDFYNDQTVAQMFSWLNELSLVK